MNWIAFLPFACERALVDYVREANVTGISADSIYAGLSHASADKPNDPAMATDIEEFADTIGNIDNENVPHESETTKNPKVVITCLDTDSIDGFTDGDARTANVAVEFTAHSDDFSGAEISATAGRLFDLFCDPNFAELCNSVSADFTIGGRDIGKCGYTIDGHNFVARLEMVIQCVAKNI